MKKLLNITSIILLLLCHHLLSAQEEKEKPELSVNLQYFSTNGSFQYLKVKTMTKEDGKLLPVKDAVLQLYLDEAIPENLIAKAKTNENGESKVTIPPALKDKWNASAGHTFIAASEATKKFEATITELAIAKAKMVIDTLFEEGTRTVTVQVLSFDSAGWVPVKDVEVKLGVRRLGGDLKIGEEETVTTDSLGMAAGEFKLDKLPAIDAKNNIVLVAKTEDNELFGNIAFEKKVPWGQYKTFTSNFGQRSLWATGDKSPLWLLLMAGFIIALVWGIIIYLVVQLIKIKKLGKTGNILQQEVTPKIILADTEKTVTDL
jgi:hypothetical protein